MSRSARRGQVSEDNALDWLQSRGLTLIKRNFHCRFGELDLVMSDGDALVVVEVRSRQTAAFMTPECSIDTLKQQRIITATRFFLQHHPQYADNAVRFDVVAITNGKIRWIRDAFAVE